MGAPAMRGQKLLALALLTTLVPLAAGENVELKAAGATMGTSKGVFGFQWDDDSAVGSRYWINGTEGDQAAFIITTCASLDSGHFSYCQRHRVTA